MKILILSIAAITGLFTACSNSSADKKNNTSSSTQPVVSNTDTATKPITDTAATAAKATVSIKDIVDTYLQMKNAFAKDNAATAATTATALTTALANFNKTALTPAQLKTYSDIEDDAKEHAAHIEKNAGNIKHQREHFDMLSKDIYQLVKTFGGGQKLYYDHCPMFNDGKGANWISETKEIKNPYFGKAMSTCGVVKEELK